MLEKCLQDIKMQYLGRELLLILSWHHAVLNIHPRVSAAPGRQILIHPHVYSFWVELPAADVVGTVILCISFCFVCWNFTAKLSKLQ